MPDDSTPSQQASQRAHGDRIKFERQLMRATGMTRQQVRQSLRDSTDFVNQVLQRQQQPPAPVAPPQVKFEQEQRSTEFEAQPLTLDSKKAGDSAGTPPKYEAITLHNGILRYADNFGILKDPL